MPSIRRRLLALAVLALVPAWGFAGFAAWRYAQSERSRLERFGRDIARAIAVEADGEVAGLRGTLAALAASPALMAGDLAAFRQQAERVRAGEHVQVLVTDPSGRLLLNTRLPPGVPLPPQVGDLDVIRRAVGSDRAVISGVFRGRTSGEYVVAAARSVRDTEGRVRCVLLVGTDALPYWSPALPRAGLPAGWIASIADAGGHILARYPNPERYVGQPVHPDALAVVAAGDGAREGWAAGASHDGELVYVAYARLGQAPWTALVGIPGDAVDNALWRAMLPVLLGGGGLLVATLVFAGVSGARLARSLGGLADAARALGRGEDPRPDAAGLAPVREAALIAAALVDAAAERRAHEAALREINASLERRIAERTAERNRLFQLSLDLFGVLGFDGRFREVNPAWSVTLGMTEAELLATPYIDLVHPEDRERTRAQIDRLRAGKRVEWFESRVRRATDGAWRSFVWTAVADPRAEDGGGSEEGAVFYCVGRDVTEERAREEQLRQAQRMEAVGQLTGGIAHDFNNLLHVISANLELLRGVTDEAEDERARRRHAAALEAVRRGASLTRQLLAYARRQPLEPRAFDPGRLLRETAELLRRTLGETIHVETVVEGGLWTAFADPGQLQNALINLAVNARDAMPQGGRLTLEAYNAHLDDRYAAAHGEVAPGRYVVFAVTDTGTGMPSEVAARAFEPFFTTKPEGQGTGLGLAMVYGFAKQSGGHVEIYTELGQGTTVKLYLPRARPGAAAAESGVASAGEGTALHKGQKETVLVVEDDASVRTAVSEMLQDLGYRVLEAPDGAAALAVLEDGAQPDILFTDVVMPGPIGSVELARRAREMRPALAVLFTSGYTENSVVHQGRLDPGVRLLSKPYSRDDLALKLRAALADARSRATRS